MGFMRYKAEIKIGAVSMASKVLLVGLTYNGSPIDNTIIETRGLCRKSVCPEKSADALYEYDVIIINPKSYSHFIFGEEGRFSDSRNELSELKKENEDYDLDNIFDPKDRELEFDAALESGTRIIWIATPDKYVNFFGYRSLYSAYLRDEIKKIMRKCDMYEKQSRKLKVVSRNRFKPYFESLTRNGWSLCWNIYDENINNIAKTPEGYYLGGEFEFDCRKIWLLTPPTSTESLETLIKCAIPEVCLNEEIVRYEGIFLSHTSEDKPFARKLKETLVERGVENVWLDEAEIMVGDSLIKKIEEGINKTTYFGIILSPRSIKSPWVERELDMAMNSEIYLKSVKVLPMLYEKCELPGFLKGKLYADFTNEDVFEESVKKLLRRLAYKSE